MIARCLLVSVNGVLAAQILLTKNYRH